MPTTSSGAEVVESKNAFDVSTVRPGIVFNRRTHPATKRSQVVLLVVVCSQAISRSPSGTDWGLAMGASAPIPGTRQSKARNATGRQISATSSTQRKRYTLTPLRMRCR